MPPSPEPSKRDRAIAVSLSDWFRANGRDYPWRRTTEPYPILVSEIMLQQTQIATVLDRGYYARWMTRFPDFETLAAASEADILKAWEGLGYYRRARNLHRLAVVVQEEHGGIFPGEDEQILALPGIGPYTAGAIASFAFNRPKPIVDGNVARVLSRLENDATPIDSTEGKKRLWDRAEALVEASGEPRLFNSALMELGQVICRPTSPLCSECPVRLNCTASAPENLPVKEARTVITETTERVFFCENSGGVLLEQEKGSRRTGMWKLPALPSASPMTPVIHRSVYGITRYRVTLWVHEAPGVLESESLRRVPLGDLDDLAMPSPYRKALRAILNARHFELKA